jgi:hypothetical protein
MVNLTDKLRTTKQRFWRVIRKQGATADPTKLLHTQIARLAGDQKLNTYLADPEFYTWFLDDRSEEDMLKAGAESAIQRLIDIITGVQEVQSATAQVTAAKILLEMAGFGPKQVKEVVYKDEAISKMDETELREYIKKQTEQLN